MSDLPHLDAEGHVHMVDVGGKQVTQRKAIAEALVTMSQATSELVFEGGLTKGDALAAVRLAGIMAAKRTADLIPLCHPLAITSLAVDVARVEAGAHIAVTATTTGATGVEMEALTGAAISALTMYDMVKGVERGVEIQDLRLRRKEGGRSGTWER